MNDWKPFAFEEPKLNKLVLIWRYKRNRYALARYSLFSDVDDDGIKKYDKEGKELMTNTWVTQDGNCHDVEPNDCWLEFPYFEMLKKFD